jgi:DNA polymerase-3 subunit epsilon
MPSEAEAVHGLSDIFLSDKPRFADKAEELLEFIGDSPLVAHNAGFDFGFLNHELERCGRRPVCMTPDGRHAGARPQPPSRRQAQPRRLVHPLRGRPLAARQAWRLLDAQLLAQVYVELTGGRQIGLGLVADVPAASNAAPASEPAPPALSRAARRIMRLGRRGIAPRAFLAKIANPLWDRFSLPLRNAAPPDALRQPPLRLKRRARWTFGSRAIRSKPAKRFAPMSRPAERRSPTNISRARSPPTSPSAAGRTRISPATSSPRSTRAWCSNRRTAPATRTSPSTARPTRSSAS